MENASKALIIAGAILISILLISVGVMVMNSATDVTGQSAEAMQDAGIQAFNAKFVDYQGSQKGSVVRQLRDKINTNNATSDHKVDFTIGGADGSSVTIKSTSTYEVKLTYGTGDDAGYITAIDATLKGSSGGSSD